MTTLMNTDEKFYEDDNGVYFKSGYLSQWYEAPFIIDDTNYNCCEKFMMYQKAIYFQDYEIAKEILNTNDPKEHKKLGRMVKNFDEEKWNNICELVVYKANYAKFTQNLNLKEKLLKTGKKIIVECSPYDNIWGNGLDITNTLKTSPENWKGTNKLGRILMVVRDNIMNNYYS